MVQAMNSDDFCERMNVLIDVVGGPAELARKSGLSRRVIDKYKSGESDPSRSRLVALAAAAGVSLRWLATGDGPMKDADPVATIRPAGGLPQGVPIYDAALSLGQGRLNGDAPVVGYLDLPDAYVRDVLHAPPGKVIVAYCSGDSMAPTIKDRDLVLIDTAATTFSRDDLYAFSFKDEGYIKRLQRAGDAFVVHSDNPAYTDWSVTGSDLRELRVIGRVVGIIQRP